MLLVGAGLATRSVGAARRADPGFDPSHVTAIAVDVKQNSYDEPRGRAFYRKLLEDVRADAGVASAALAAFVPLGLLDTRALNVTVEGYAPRRDEDMAFMSNPIASDYFGTLRIPVVGGRALEDRDDEAAPPVAMVNTTFAERFWGSTANAIGKRIQIGDSRWRTIVGVAADVKYSRINEAPRPYVYLPFFQSYRSAMVLHTRGAAPMDRLLEQGRAHVAALDANQPILYARPMEEMLGGAFIFFDLTATMLLIFGVTGTGLAALGTYGLVSYVVRQSTREIGIRMTLGASRSSVIRGFVARGLRLGAIGATLGIAAALGVSRFLGSVLFGVSPTDATSFAGALAIVLGGVVVATIVPAWRAARTNALSALRHQ